MYIISVYIKDKITIIDSIKEENSSYTLQDNEFITSKKIYNILNILLKNIKLKIINNSSKYILLLSNIALYTEEEINYNVIPFYSYSNKKILIDLYHSKENNNINYTLDKFIFSDDYVYSFLLKYKNYISYYELNIPLDIFYIDKNYISYFENIINNTNYDNTENTTYYKNFIEEIEQYKKELKEKANNILKEKIDETIYLYFISLYISNTVLNLNNYYITENNKEESYNKIINETEENLLNYFNEYNDSYNNLINYYNYYEYYMNFIKSIDTIQSKENIKHTFEMYSKNFI